MTEEIEVTDASHDDVEETRPRGVSDQQWLRMTWALAGEAKKAAESAMHHARAASHGSALVLLEVKRLRAAMAEAFKVQGVRLRDVARRASDSQLDAAEAKAKASEVESTAIRNFVEDAKPFGRWKRDLVVAAIGIAATVASAAACKACGLHPIGENPCPVPTENVDSLAAN